MMMILSRDDDDDLISGVDVPPPDLATRACKIQLQARRIFTKREGKIINRRIGNPMFSECVQGTFDGGSSGERPYQLTFQLKLR
jgi:hypothetical protein